MKIGKRYSLGQALKSAVNAAEWSSHLVRSPGEGSIFIEIKRVIQTHVQMNNVRSYINV